MPLFSKKTVLLVFLLLLSGCGSSGVTNLSLVNEPIPDKKARLVINRNQDLLYLAMAANVFVNGQKIASLGRGGSVVHDVPSGRVDITMMSFGSATLFSSSFDVKPSKSYNFEISPRSEALWTGTAYGTLFGIFGDIVNAHIHENTGYFEATLKDVK